MTVVRLDSLKPGTRFRWSNVLFELQDRVSEREGIKQLGVIYVEGTQFGTPAGTLGLMDPDDLVQVAT